jgi:hypothetical protein
MAMCGVAEESERGIEWGKENLKGWEIQNIYLQWHKSD